MRIYIGCQQTLNNSNPFGLGISQSFSNWWPIRYGVGIDSRSLKPGSTLKVYLWNVDKQEAYIDDFEVRIYGE